MTAAVYVGTFAPGSEQWHQARAAGLGGSEVAAVLGLSPFESRFSLWHRKSGIVGPGEVPPEAEWGTRLEPAIRQKFIENHPELGIREVGTWRSLERPWQVANPDGLGGDCLWEGKYAVNDLGWGPAGTDDVPVYYRAQVLHYLDVFELEVAHLSVLIAGHDYREYVIAYDRAEAERNRAECLAFLTSVEERVRPDIDDHSETYQVIRELHPDIEPESVALNSATAERYLAANAAEKAAKTEKRHATSLVADEMGNARSATYLGDTVAIRMCRENGTPYVQAKPAGKQSAAA